MAQVTYLTPDGGEILLDVPSGQSLMQAAVAEGVPGIVAQCSGAMSCGTCHVHVEDGDSAALPPMSDDEDDLLYVTASHRNATSRLSCQLVMTEAVRRLTVRIAERQT